jgi:hypothetical protein
MTIYHWILLAGFLFFFLAFWIILIQNLSRKRARDYAEPKGSAGKAAVYSFTGAMSPAKKESA